MIQRRIVVLLLSILLAIPTVFGGAQPSSPEAAMRDERPGIVAEIWRTYAHPDAEIGRAMTAEDMATLTLRTIDITVTSFTTPDNAAAYFDSISASPFDLGTTDEAFDGEVAADLGTQHVFRQRIAHDQWNSVVMEILIVQQEELVYTINLAYRASYRDGATSPPELTVPDVTIPLGWQMVDKVKAEPGGDEVADGNTADELWRLLPATGDPLLLGLVPLVDLQTFPPVDPDSATPTASTGTDRSSPVDVTTLDGLEEAGQRLYYPADPPVGIEQGTSATPQSDHDPAARHELALAVTIYQFATADDALAAYLVLSRNFVLGDMMASQSTGTAVAEQTEVVDLGDGATSSRMVISTAGYDWVRQMTLEQLTVLDENLVIVVESVGNRGPAPNLDQADDAMSPAVEIAAEMVAAGSPTSGATDFAAHGTSTGGLWDLMPASGDPALLGLTPEFDLPIFPPMAG